MAAPAIAAAAPRNVAPETIFRVKPAFRTVLGLDSKQDTFSYAELIRNLSAYIISNKDRFFDLRNCMVVMCGADDPLGQAFGVTAFHRSQVG
jgi:hypothetical protein